MAEKFSKVLTALDAILIKIGLVSKVSEKLTKVQVSNIAKVDAAMLSLVAMEKALENEKSVSKKKSMKLDIKAHKKVISNLNKQQKAHSDHTKKVEDHFTILRANIADSLGLGPVNKFIEGLTHFKDTVRKSGLTMNEVWTRFASRIAKFAGILAVLIAAFAALRRMFQLNVGGMATKWAKFMGQMKRTWAKFQVAFSKALLALGPIFDVIFGALYSLVQPIIFTLNTLIDVFNMIPGPLKLVGVAIGIVTAAMLGLSAASWWIIAIVAGVVLLTKVFNMMPKPLKLITLAILGISAGIATATIAMLYFNASTGGILLAIGLIVVGVVALIALAKNLYDKFKAFAKTHQTFAKVAKVLLFIVNPFYQIWVIGKAVIGMFKKVNSEGGRLAKLGKILYAVLVFPFMLSHRIMKLVYKFLIGSIIKRWDNLLARFPKIVSAVILMKNAFTGFFKFIWAGLKALPDAFMAVFNGVVDGVIGMFNSLVNILPDWAKGLLGIEEIKSPTIDSSPAADAGNTRNNAGNTSNNQIYNTTVNTTQTPEKVMLGLDSLLAKDLSN